MSKQSRDASGASAQLYGLPETGKTSHVVGSAGVGTQRIGPLAAGVYRILSDQDVFICSGQGATTTAVGTDLPISASVPEYFEVQDQDYIAVYDSVGGANVYASLMP